MLIFLCRDLNLHDGGDAQRLGFDLLGFGSFEKRVDAGVEVAEPNLEECGCQVFLRADVEVDLCEVAGVTASSEYGLRPKGDEDGQVFFEVDLDDIRKDIGDGGIGQQFLVKGVDEVVEVVLVFDVFHKKRPPYEGTLKLLNVEFFEVEGNGFFLFVVLHQQYVAHFTRKHLEIF